MTAARIMHVDDEPDMREVVRQSLGIDPDLMVRSCASGAEALAVAREWPPDLVLLDDMMPNMNGPATLANLRLNRDTAAIPVVFITSMAQREPGYFKALGAVGVLAKPFDAQALVEAVRKYLRPRPSAFDTMKKQFLKQAEAYAIELTGCVKALAAGVDHADVLIHARQVAHRLVDSEGIFAHHLIGGDAQALEEALTEERGDAEIQAAIDRLVARISAAVDAGVDPRSGAPTASE